MERSIPKEKKDWQFKIGDMIMVRGYRKNTNKPSQIWGVAHEKLGSVTNTVQVGSIQWKRNDMLISWLNITLVL